MNMSEILLHQLESLQQVVNRSYTRVSFYRNEMDKRGVSPEQIESLDDIKKLPFTTREDLKTCYPYDFFAVPLRDIVRLHTLKVPFSNPIVLGYTRSDVEKRRKLISDIFISFGITADDIIQIYLDRGMIIWGLELKDGAEQLGALTIPPDPISVNELLMVMRDFKTTVLITTPSLSREILHEIKVMGISLAGLALKRVILLGEHVGEDFRALLEDHLSVEVYSMYGLIELGGPCAFECKMHAGYHIAMDYFIPEIIDPQTGEVLGDGEEGELVLTTLKAKANPLIRFRTGDITRLIKDKCACGRDDWRISPVERVCDGRINVRGIKIKPEHISDFLSKYNLTSGFTFRIKEKGYRIEPQLEIGLNSSDFTGSLPELHDLIIKMESDFHDIFGFSCKIRPVEPYRLGERVVIDR